VTTGAAAGAIDVAPATAERWPDVEEILAATARECHCMYWRLASGDYSRSSPEGRSAGLRAWADDGVPPGVIAYADGTPVGWCGIGPRARMERLVRSRTIRPVDDLPVWSIVCFAVRVGFRRRGVSRALLGGAVEVARDAGAPAVEAYAVDPGGRRVDVAFGYVGFTSVFEAAGFRRVEETAARSAGLPRWLMRLDLTGTTASR
jgi:GNAT superfamily N-acetyltransferase